MNAESQKAIMDWLKTYFSTNPGYHSKVPFHIEGTNYRFIHVDTEFTNEGITRFQGVICYKYQGYIYKSDRLSVVPLWLMPYIKSYHITEYYQPIHNLCYTIWFKEPLTRDIINSLPETL